MSALAKFLSPFGKSTYVNRRNRLIQKVRDECKSDFTALFWSGSEVFRNFDNHFPFRADSDFLYLTGFSEPDCLLIIQHSGGKSRISMGLRPRDLSPHRGSEIWEGERLGVERAKAGLGIDEAFDIAQKLKIAKKAIAGSPTLYWSFGIHSELDEKIVHLAGLINSEYRGISPLKRIQDPRSVLHEMRKIKSADEIEIMRESAEIAAHGHIRAMKIARPGMYEYEVQADLEREFKRLGAQSVAYSSIVAAGNNSCTLHYRASSSELKPDDILLIDAGAERDGYASDITRTFPVGQTFSPAQREVYSWVLKGQIAAVKAVRPGATFTKVQDAATKIISTGLSKMGVFRGTPESIFKKGLWKHFMPHGVGHWLGLDTHDRGIYRDPKNADRPFPFQPGNVVTVEPGLYFNEKDKSAPKKFRGIGVRIEDDVAVTRNGFDVLTKNCPKSIDAIEALRATRF